MTRRNLDGYIIIKQKKKTSTTTTTGVHENDIQLGSPVVDKQDLLLEMNE